MHEQLGAGAQRLVGDGVHVADDHVRPVARLEQRVGAAVDRDQHGLEVADVRLDHAQVALVARAPCDDERVAVAKAGRERREIDPFREQLSLLAQVAHRVLGERLECLGDAAALFAEHAFELSLVEHAS